MRHVFIALALIVPLTACGAGSSRDQAASAPAGAAPKATYFVVPTAQLAHVQVAPVVKTTWQTTLRTTGTVDWDNDHTTQAISQVSGPIARIVVDIGAHVAAGDPLLYAASPDVTNAISAYRKAKNRLALAQRTLDRNRDLLAHKAISQSVMESVEADYNDAATDVQNSLQPLRILGVTEADLADAERQGVPIRPELPMRAPIAGDVVQKLVLPGQFIQAGQTVAFVISDVSTVWVRGHIYEKDLTSVHVGDEVEARTSSFPAAFHGRVAAIDSLVDPVTRTTLVRIVTKNAGALLKKDMFLDLVIHDQMRRGVLAVPVGAVLYDDQNFPFVYVQMETGKFAQRLVKVGGQQGDQIEILDGLTETDRIVSQGSLFLQFANIVG
jgi:cobalt-zinc-cadmium efflux system membrane fusion protein